MENIPINPNIKPEAPKPEPGKKLVLGLMLDAGIEFAVIIAGPLIIFLILRAKLHKETSVLFTIIGILLALAVSATLVGFKINELRKKLK